MDTRVGRAELQSFCYRANVSVLSAVVQVNKSKTRHRRLRELQAPGTIQWMGLLSERLYVGYQSGFTRYRYLPSPPLTCRPLSAQITPTRFS